MAETKSLITELPKIIERGKKQVERILDNLSKKNKITLQTNELVLPTKAKGGVIHNGEVIGIVGPNATGKTTFVKMLAGNIKPSKGNVTSVKVS
ncbi:MAG: ATP-binding cassette domain-containing protein, partial [Thermoplasmatales archaeon]|nr:ATP-binding cassette domain-containing protein [Thermoplasmatales archaeon]